MLHAISNRSDFYKTLHFSLPTFTNNQKSAHKSQSAFSAELHATLKMNRSMFVAARAVKNMSSVQRTFNMCTVASKTIQLTFVDVDVST